MPDLPDYNNNEPKGEWPGGSTGQKCGSVSRLYFLSFVYKASGMAVLAPVEHSSVVELPAYIRRVFTQLKNGTITDQSQFYQNKTIKETVDYLESGIGTIVFWILWITLIIACTFGFYYLENAWLE